MRKKVNIYVLSFLVMFFCATSYAQKTPPQPNNGGKESGLAPLPGLPIDGGILYLIISGVIYGIYKSEKKNK